VGKSDRISMGKRGSWRDVGFSVPETRVCFTVNIIISSEQVNDDNSSD